jgi:tRNA A-37 threonylcarbamoyl transferase component Bud32
MSVGGPALPGSEDPLLGKVLSERYRILRKLGEGGMGVVYLAEHVVIEKKIALKVLFPDLTRRSDLVHRFMQEAKSASRIGHENVIDITDFGQSPEGYVFIAMEYLVGQDLGQVLKASGPMPWVRAQPIILQIVKALRAAHERGIIHRDMKPENIFILPRDDGREFVKVLDFGIAKVLGLDEDAPRLTRTGMIFGTPEYMSPEQAQGQQVDHRVDIYAVGCIMYHVLTGDVPFRAESFMGILSKHMMEAPAPPRTRNPDIDPLVEAVVMRAMDKDPAKRFQTMGEFVEALVPLGSVPDMSGAIYAASGAPVQRPAVSARPPTQAAGPERPATHVTAAERPSARALAAPAAPLSVPASGPLPHATREMQGRASAPLAAANPEVRRSRTAIFDIADEAPPPRPRSNHVALIAGVGAVVLLAIVVFLLRGRPAAPGAAPALAGATVPGAAPVVPAAAEPAEVAGAARAGAAAARSPVKVEAKAEAKAEVKTAPPAASSAAVTRRHRTSREAIDSLFPAGADEAATTGDAGGKPTAGGRSTPAELKNPFAAPLTSPSPSP